MVNRSQSSNNNNLMVAGIFVVIVAIVLIAFALTLNTATTLGNNLAATLNVGNLTGGTDVSFSDGDAIDNLAYTQMDIDAGAPPYAEGRYYWDSVDQTLSIQQGVDGVTLQVGQELYIRVRNASGSTIVNGSVVHIEGVTGQRPQIHLAQANSVSTAELIGVTTHDLENNSDGLITVMGLVRDVDTSAFTEGDTVYLSAAVAGEFVGTIPATPNVAAHVGTVTYAHASNGVIFIQTTPFVEGILSYDKLRIHGYLEYDTTAAAPSYGEGTLFYDNDADTLGLYNSDVDVTHQLGQEGLIKVYNESGDTIPDGSVVYISGAEVVENRPTIALAQSDDKSTSEVIGFATHTIENDSFGFVTYWGLVNNLDTSAFATKDILYLDETTPGAMRNTRPPAGNFIIQLGYVVRSHATLGRIVAILNPELVTAGNPIAKSYSITTQGGFGSGDFWLAGFYDFPVADANLTQASTNIAYGTAANPYGAHASMITAAAGSVDTGTVSMVVSGTSIDSSGTRITSDSETILADITAATVDGYYETSKKWLGTVTYTLTITGGAPTTYSLDFNYGYSKYDDFGNSNFELSSFEMVGEAGGADASFEIVLYHHSATGWTYHATAFEPGNSQIASTATDLGGDDNLANGIPFAYKRTNLAHQIIGSDSEGFIIRISTTSNNAISFANAHVGVILN